MIREPEPIDGQSEAYRRLFDAHPAAMAIWDPATGLILAANEAAARQYGYRDDEIVGLSIERIVHPDDLPRLREQLPLLPEGLAGRAPFRHLRRDGSVIEVEMSGHPLEWAGRPARLVVATDVTDRRRLEEELREARALEAVGRLAGGIAHDFNNLVMAINGFAELLLEHLPSDGDARDAALEIESAGRRAAALTTQLLAFARPHEARPAPFDLNELIVSLGPTIRGIVGPNVEVVVAAEAEAATVVADRGHLAQAIVGCALNARQVMPRGGRLRIATEAVERHALHRLAGVDDELPYVGVVVADTGGVEGAGPGRGGAGLGLALLYSLVQLAGGRLRLEGTPGRGSAVRIFLPIADGAEDPEALRVGWPSPGEGHVDVGVDETGHPPNETDDRNVAVGSRRLARIVVVEDEPAVRSLVERVLRRAGYDVAAFRDGDAALDALADRSVPVDLLLTDVVMPGPNGFEVARRLRETRPDVPVVVMSGHASDEVRAGGGSIGVAAALTKPFTVPDLLDQVGAALAAKARAGRRDSPA